MSWHLMIDDPLRNRRLDVLTDQCLCSPTVHVCCQAAEISHFNARLLVLYNKLIKHDTDLFLFLYHDANTLPL